MESERNMGVMLNKDIMLTTKFNDSIWQILLFLMIFIPRKGQTIKLVLLSALLFLSILSIMKIGKIRISREILIFYSFHIIYTTFSGFHGLIKGNPGANDFLRINLVYYLIFLIVLSAPYSQLTLDGTIRTILISGGCVSIYTILLFLVKIGIWPERFFIYFDITSNVGVHAGYTHLVNTNLSMMIFILPFLMVLFLEKHEFKNVRRSIVIIILLLTIGAVLLSGRRILWLSFIIPFFYCIFKHSKKITKEKVKTIFSLVFIMVLLFTIIFKSSYLSFEGIITRFSDAFNKNVEDTRFLQMKALWDGFLEVPILGSGAGAGVNNSTIYSSKPWVREMTYNLILYNSGIFGIIIFFSSHLYVIYRLFKKSKENSNIGEGLLIAYITMLIASGTNPYFTSSFDFLWFIVFPLMYLNTNVNFIQ